MTIPLTKIAGAESFDGFVVALFCGARRLDDYKATERAVDEDMQLLNPAHSIVVEGGANGVDRIARRRAAVHGIHVATVEALWGKFGKSAGRERNLAMTWLRPHICFAYPTPSSIGTPIMVELCERAGTTVYVRPQS